MRSVLVQKLKQIMDCNEKIVIINADLAKAAGLAEIISRFPKRCFNVGVAEQNMTGVAAGISSYGFVPLIFTFAPFATRRICDQLAVSVCYARQNVKVFGLDPGISAEYNGGTHMSFEDIGVLRSIPEFVIFEPCDTIQLEKSLDSVVNHNGAVYIRMFRKETPKIFCEDYDFDLFGSDLLKVGRDITIFCTGIMVEESLAAGKILENIGISAEIINIHTIKPIDKKTIINSAKKTKHIVTAENHNVFGGLFSAVSEVLSENYPVPIGAIGICDKFGQVGKMPFLKKYYKLTSEDIAKKAKEVLAR